jgi:hypothetical protein
VINLIEKKRTLYYILLADRQLGVLRKFVSLL